MAPEGACGTNSRMNPERWRHIERIYHEALEEHAARRESFVAQACGSDDELRQEILAMLAQPPEGETLNGPAWAAAPHLLAEALPAELKPGAMMGLYRIEHLLGAGGM